MRFVWANKPPRIKSSLLTRPKAMGGIGFPDFRTYYMPHTSLELSIGIKDWVLLENGLSSIPLHFSPWIPKSRYPQSMRSHPLIGTTLGIFHLLIKHPKFYSPLSPLTSLQNNPDFPPGVRNHLLISSDKKMLLLALHFFNKKIIKDLTQFRGPITISLSCPYGHTSNP